MAARELTNEKIRNEYGLFIALGIFALLLLGIFEWVGWLSGGWLFKNSGSSINNGALLV